MIESEVTRYRVYRIRWLQLIVYFLATFANALHGVTFAPIASETSAFFNITTLQVDALAIVFNFLYVVGSLLSTLLYRSLSLRMVVIIGCLLNLGVFIRLFALISPSNGYAALIIGQLFPAISAPFFIDITALFAARWYASKQRDLATAICSMANPLGSAIGYLFPTLIINENYTSTSFLILLLVEACFTALTTILIIFIFRSHPASPPAPSEEQPQSIEIKKNLIGLFTNWHYLILFFSFSIGSGLFSAITTVLDQIIEPLGYTSDNAGVFGAITIIAGLINAIIVGLIMDRTRAYRIILKILLIGACASGIFLVLILQPNQFYPLAVAIGLLGFFLLPLLPVSFECAVECTYPIRAEWSTGFLMCSGSVLGGVFIIIFEALLKLPSVSKTSFVFTPTSIFILCGLVIATIVLMFYNGPYLRLEAERAALATTTTTTVPADETTTTTIETSV